jgi:8-oxo-dGTP diphosphatase
MMATATTAAAAPAAAATAEEMRVEDEEEYAIQGLMLPLSDSFSQRLRTQLRRTSSSVSPSAAASSTASSAGATAAAASAASSSLALRCDWRVRVARTSSAATALSASAAAPSGPLSSSSPPLSLAMLAPALSFVAAHYPFANAQDAADGLTRFVALWPSLSAASRAANTAERMPNIRRVHLRAQLVEWNAAAASLSSGSELLPATSKHLLEVSATRRADECRMLGSDTFNAWGDVDILLESPLPASTADEQASSAAPAAPQLQPAAATGDVPSAGLYCLNLLPGARIPLHVHLALVEREFLLSSGRSAGAGYPASVDNNSNSSCRNAALDGRLTCQDEAVQPGDVHVWLRDQPHSYFNSSASLQRILCIDVPRFERHFEVEVPERAGEKLSRPVQHPLTFWRYVLESSSDTRFVFPGGLPSQRVTLSTNPALFRPQPHAVLVFVLQTPEAASASAPSAEPGLLFVHHRRRGWELPGGKVDAGESAAEAAVREVAEESGLTLDEDALIPLAQYVIEETGQPEHVKTVFVARAPSSAATSSAGAVGQVSLVQETDQARFLRPPPSWDQLRSRAPNTLRFSSILHDNVYPLCLQLAQARLQRSG